MKVNNPFKMNYWPIGKFLIVILCLQLAMFGSIGLDMIGLHIPLFREFVSFIYLTFVPGIIILRILKLEKLDSLETLLYSAGLSLAVLMFTGFLMNSIYPHLGLSGPISLTYLIITISTIVIVLCIICNKIDNDFFAPNYIEFGDILSFPALFLYLLPFFAIFGAYSVNYSQNNFLLIFMMVFIASIVLLIGFDIFIPKKFYPLAVFLISFSLLFHNSLISDYIWGWDIHYEYFYANDVIKNSLWDSTIYGNVNAMLSIVMLAPIYSNISGVSLTWILKIIYPLIFSLVPLGLYRIFRKQTNDRIAFLAVFFCVSFFTFYTEMLALARQQIAELFLILILFLLIDKNMNKIKRSLLYIIFAFSIIVSHYGISYIFMALLIYVWCIFYIFKKYKPENLNININSYSVLLYVTFVITWYMYISSSSVLSTIVHIGGQISDSIYSDFLNPATADPVSQITKAEGASILMRETISPLHEISKYLHLISQFSIVIGFFTVLLKYSKMKFEKEYIAFSLGNLMILLASIAIPYFANSLNTTRLYQITLIFLAPYGIIGGITILDSITRAINPGRPNDFGGRSIRLISIFFVVYFLFNSGFIYEITKDNPDSISLSKETIINYANVAGKVKYYTTIIPDQDYYSTVWMSKYRNYRSEVYNDVSRRNNVLLSYGDQGVYSMITSNAYRMSRNSYIYLGYLNNVEGIVVGPRFNRYWNISNIEPYLDNSSKIYTNNGSIVYRN